jgi:alkylation response protein AidB-like acyl-CoA dehydrogenase
VVAHGPEGFVMAGVNVSSVTVIPLESVDPSRPCVDVVIDTEIDPALVRSFDAAEAQDVARVVLAAELVGVVDRLIELTADHARSRSQFDRPIGAFQAVKHRLADLYVALERARSLTYAAAMTLDDDDESRSTRRAAALAKAAASEVAVNAARSAVQLHGAMAITWEHDVHLLARRARHGALWLGDARTQYERAARLALDEAS